jgi:hypothetical protein
LKVLASIEEPELIERILLGGDIDIVILFHDLHAHTADNLGTANGYIKLIQDVCATVGRTPVFQKL